LINLLAAHAQTAFNEREKNSYAFDSSLLSSYKPGGKGGKIRK
jgi:hypothetical protein